MHYTHVATAGFLITFRTHQISLLCKESDNVPFSEKLTQLMSYILQLLLFSQFADFGLHLELLTSGAEVPADILADARDFTVMSLKFHIYFTAQTSSPVFQCVACDTIDLLQQHNGMRSPSLLCPTLKSTYSCQHFRSRHFRGPCS